MGGGLELSFVTEGEAWVMFDGMTAEAIKMAPCIAAFDKIVADAIKTDPTIHKLVVNLVRAEYLNKRWIYVG